MIIGTMRFSKGSIINGMRVEDMTNAEKGAFIASQKDKGRKQFTHFVEPKLNKAFFNEDHSVFNDVEYDDHGADVFELCDVTLNYFDTTYMNDDNCLSIREHIESLPAERMMEREDYKRYKLRR